MLVTVLAWAAVALGTLVLSLLSWFALRVVHQLDHIGELMVTQNLAFTEEIHKHDLRIARLEGVAGWNRRENNGER